MLTAEACAGCCMRLVPQIQRPASSIAGFSATPLSPARYPGHRRCTTLL